MSIHDGHRQRLKDRFKKEGLDNFEKLQVLELLLFYCIPRQDTNPLAHRLLDRFGTVSGVLEALPSELKKVEGTGENTAQFLRLIMEVMRYCAVERKESDKILTTLNDCGAFLIPYFQNRRNETVFLLSLDAKCKVISCKMVGEGSVNSAGVPIRRIVELALGEGATTVVLAHNHPSGVALPSEEDKATTLRLARALAAVEITLIDHMVIADDDFVSMVQSGIYDPNDAYIYG
mgnify:CR=1 FL=1